MVSGSICRDLHPSSSAAPFSLAAELSGRQVAMQEILCAVVGRQCAVSGCGMMQTTRAGP